MADVGRGFALTRFTGIFSIPCFFSPRGMRTGMPCDFMPDDGQISSGVQTKITASRLAGELHTPVMQRRYPNS